MKKLKRILLYEADVGLSANIASGFAFKPDYRIDTCTNLYQFGKNIDSYCMDYFGILLSAEVLLDNPNYEFTLNNIREKNPFVKIIILASAELPVLLNLLNQKKIDNILSKSCGVDEIAMNLEKETPYSQTSVNPISTTNNFKQKEISFNNMSNLGFKPNNENYGGYNMGQNNGFPQQGFPQQNNPQQNSPQQNNQGFPQQNFNSPAFQQGFPQPNFGQQGFPQNQQQMPQGYPQQPYPAQSPVYGQNPYPQQGFVPQGNNQNGFSQQQNENGEYQQPAFSQPYPSQPSMGSPMQPPMGQPMNAGIGMPPMGMPQQQKVIRVADRTVITVHSPKGGVGKSTISKELAVTYALSASSQNMKVCLVDMNIDYGNIAVMLDIKPVKTMAVWARNICKKLTDQSANNINPETINYSWEEIENHYLLRHSSGLYVLAAPTNHRDAGAIGEIEANVMIDNLKKYFDILIIDTGPDIKDVTFTSLKKANHVLLVCNMEIPTLNDLDQLQKTLKNIGFDLGKISIIMNETPKEMENEAIETVKYLNFEHLIGIVPKSQNVTVANDKGIALSQSPDNSFTIAIKQIANTLCPIVKAPSGPLAKIKKERKSFFGRKK